jgi:maleylacetate reductase
MFNFRYEILPSRIIFGAGARREVKQEVETLKWSRVMVISTPEIQSQAEQVASDLGASCAGLYTDAVQHVPVETAERALKKAKELNVDGLIAVGGGSAIGLAKALALKASLPIMALPTTYAGSEMTPVWGMTESGVKTTGRNPVVKPKVVIYDPELTLSLPVPLSMTSGINAMAHCVEGLYTKDANPIISLIAEEGIRALFQSLPKLRQNGEDLEGRSEALYGSWLGGTVLGSVGMALHHKLCHVLGGSYNLPHAETHTVILPYALAYNAPYVPQAVEAIKRAFKTNDQNVAGVLHDFLRSLEAPVSLAEIGMEEGKLKEAAALAVQNPYYNPRPVSIEAIERLLSMAYHGDRPELGDL